MNITKPRQWMAIVFLTIWNMVFPIPILATSPSNETTDYKEGELYKKTNPIKHKSPAKDGLRYHYSSGVVTIYSETLSFEVYEIEFKGWNQDQYLDLHEYNSSSIQTGLISGQFELTCLTSMGIFEATVTL